MSKRKVSEERKQHTISYTDFMETAPTQKIFKTNRGYELEICPIPLYRLDKIRSKFNEVEPPTFKQSLATVFEGDEPQTYTMTEEDLEVPDDPEETRKRKTLWKEYEEKDTASKTKFGLKFIDLILTRGVRIVDFNPQEDQRFLDWEEYMREDMEDEGEEFPASLNKIRCLYLKDEVLENFELPIVQALVLSASGERVDMEDVQAAIASFPDTL